METYEVERNIERNHYLQNKHFDYGYMVQVITQIKTVLDLDSPGNILEIGIGNGNLSSLLKNYGFDVTTCDFNKQLNPDYFADIRELPFVDNSFDTILVFETLEHISFHEFEETMRKLSKICRRNVIFSVPYSCITLSGLTRLIAPYIIKNFSFNIKIPYSWFTSKGENVSHPEHCWAVGRRGFPKKRIRNVIEQFFNVKKVFIDNMNPNQIFFVLDKK